MHSAVLVEPAKSGYQGQYARIEEHLYQACIQQTAHTRDIDFTSFLQLKLEALYHSPAIMTAMLL